MKEVELHKIFIVNQLINQVASNTVKESEGKRGDLAGERRRTKELLRLLLGRSPTNEEIDLALSPVWSKQKIVAVC